MLLDSLSPSASDTSTYALLATERTGIPIAEVEVLKQRYGFTDRELLSLLRMNVRTLQRRRKGGQALDAHESAAFVAVARALAYGHEVFGDIGKLVRWLRHPNGTLQSERPLDLLATSTGLRIVCDTLTRIDYGVYS